MKRVSVLFVIALLFVLCTNGISAAGSQGFYPDLVLPELSREERYVFLGSEILRLLLPAQPFDREALRLKAEAQLNRYEEIEAEAERTGKPYPYDDKFAIEYSYYRRSETDKAECAGLAVIKRGQYTYCVIILERSDDAMLGLHSEICSVYFVM